MNKLDTRNYTIDIMKGIGITLVVLYHAIDRNIPDALSNGLFTTIASFFMQLFMIVSGYLVYQKVGDNQWVKSHITRWFLPLAIFTLIYWLVAHYFGTQLHYFAIYSDNIGQYLVGTLVSGFGGLVIWYLWCLILCYMATWLLERMTHKYSKIPFTLQWIGLIIFINILPVDAFGIYTFKWYGSFFIIGYAIHHYFTIYNNIITKILHKLSYLSLILFPLCIYLTNWMIHFQDNDYGTIGVASILPAVTHGNGLLILLMIFMALLGTCFVYSISRLFNHKYIRTIFVYLGEVSIGVYLFHVMFVGLVHSYWLSSLIAIAISLILYEFLHRIKITNRILFGNTK